MARLNPIIAVYSPHIQHFKLSRFICVDYGPDTVDFNFNAFGPYLVAFANLTHLHLDGFELIPGATATWPTPRATLHSLLLGVTSPQLEPADFDWFADASRASLRGLGLSGYSPDLLNDLIGWGRGLCKLTLVVLPARVSGQLGMLEQLGGMKGLDRLELVNGHSDGAAVRPVAKEVNRRVGREVAFVL
jgi:hypothetical protein